MSSRESWPSTQNPHEREPREKTCPQCGGTGTVTQKDGDSEKKVTCPKCGGKGTIVSQ